MAYVSLSLGVWTVPDLSYKLSKATVHNNWTAVFFSGTFNLSPGAALQLQLSVPDWFPKLRSKLFCNWRSLIGVYTNLGPMTRFLLLLDTCCFLVVGHPPWWEDTGFFWSKPTDLQSLALSLEMCLLTAHIPRNAFALLLCSCDLFYLFHYSGFQPSFHICWEYEKWLYWLFNTGCQICYSSSTSHCT
jgi:hypothetical protein